MNPIKKLIPVGLKDFVRPYYRYGRQWFSIRKLKKKENEEKSGKHIAAIKPTVINFNANDICNSKCAMCSIWEQKQGFEVSPEQLGVVLSNPLFQEVKHIGITGGEPTLREDLPLLYEAAIKAIPGIQGLSIITNAIKEKDVIARIEKVVKVCADHGKRFSMMVSLDGYGNAHDKVRGRAGNFQTAINVIDHFKSKGVPLAIGCTISKVNVWDVDEFLHFLQEKDIYGRFRVAEFIKRLYNDNKIDAIRNFDEDETYHLILFFYKVMMRFERNAVYNRTYRSIINILGGGKRLIGCPYHAKGVVLNSRAEMAYCAPKSKIIGNTLNESANDIFVNNVAERNRIIHDECDNCIHDYHAPITAKEKEIEQQEAFWKDYVSLNGQLSFSVHNLIKPRKSAGTQIFITGWYGTETVGDKAILGGIIDDLYAKYGQEINLVISSLYPLITIRTLRELNVKAAVVPVYDKQFVQFAKGSDVVIMGGGPLMDLEHLALPLRAFQLAKASGKKTIVFGCGLGPLTEKKYIEATKEILRLADEIKLRDKKSIDLAKSWLGGERNIELSGDPAKKYLQRYSHSQLKENGKKVLRCFLREWTYEYSKDISPEEFKEKKIGFEKGLAILIQRKAEELGVSEIILEHMHNFVVGNDDRDFSRYFIRNYFADYTAIPISFNKYLSTVDSIVNAMQTSSFNICMRFHSVVFAHTLQTEFLAIDYTKGGKIHNYLSDNNALNRLVSIEGLLQESENLF